MACDADHEAGPIKPDADVDSGPDGSIDTDADAGPSVPPEWFEADPLGRTTADNHLEALPEMIIVSDAELAPAWEECAALRSLEGRHTIFCGHCESRGFRLTCAGPRSKGSGRKRHDPRF